MLRNQPALSSEADSINPFRYFSVSNITHHEHDAFYILNESQCNCNESGRAEGTSLNLDTVISSLFPKKNVYLGHLSAEARCLAVIVINP